jgi:hypothetical protein
MSYPTICDPCLEGRHGECRGTYDVPLPPAIGGAHCVCEHGEPETLFVQDVRRKRLAAREQAFIDSQRRTVEKLRRAVEDG